MQAFSLRGNQETRKRDDEDDDEIKSHPGILGQCFQANPTWKETETLHCKASFQFDPVSMSFALRFKGLDQCSVAYPHPSRILAAFTQPHEALHFGPWAVRLQSPLPLNLTLILVFSMFSLVLILIDLRYIVHLYFVHCK